MPNNPPRPRTLDELLLSIADGKLYLQQQVAKGDPRGIHVAALSIIEDVMDIVKGAEDGFPTEEA